MIDAPLPEPLLAVLVLLFLLWPLLGQYALARFDKRREKSGKAAIIPTADTPGEILARMYLWPVVLYRYRRAARALDQSNSQGEPR
ncbi:MAG: hypothetical protein H6980_06190 [Gammaproteobacteria bacterium]|nr:hypothetical protein [Gammaproteobacteria bacterium]